MSEKTTKPEVGDPDEMVSDLDAMTSDLDAMIELVVKKHCATLSKEAQEALAKDIDDAIYAHERWRVLLAYDC